MNKYIEGKLLVSEPTDGKKDEFVKQRSQTSTSNADKSLVIVPDKYYSLHSVTKACEVIDFVRGIPGLTYSTRLGYGFYEFTKPELISYDKQVILMDKVFT